MNIIIWMGILTGFFLTIWANDLLSKFHQTDYKTKNLFVQQIYMDEDFIEKYEIKTFKYNRSVTAFNSTLCTKADSGRKVDILVQAYKRTSIAYRVFPVRFQVNFCKIFNKNIVGFQNIVQHGNITSCEFKKGVIYYVYNFMIDDSMLPPLIPTGEFKVEATTLYLEKPVLVISITAEVYRPVTPP